MRKILYIIFALFFVSCTWEIFPEEHLESVQSGVSSQICPSVHVKSSKLPPAATRALVDETTVVSLEGNALRIDESDNGEFDSWKKANILETTVSSSPSADPFLRSMSLNPVQAYKVDENSSKYYHTRMVTWFPRTCDIHKNAEGKASLMHFDHFRDNYNKSVYEESAADVISLNFKDLDGSKDVMVSNIVEGQYWHIDGGNERYTVPFGHSNVAPIYSNYMTYYHYLSAVKVYAVVENSEQDVSMWGAIRKVIVKNQPGTMSVTLPSPNDMPPAQITKEDGKILQENSPIFGSSTFSGNVDFPLIKTPMYGTQTDDPNDPGYAEDAPYLDPKAPVYLGYALIKPNVEPNQKLELDVHTEAGVLSVVVPMTVGETSYFNPGFVYQVNINFNTEGAIANIVLQSGDEHYLDLSSGVDLSVGDGEDGTDDGVAGNDFEYGLANCYIISSEMMRRNNGEYYDGYAFSATTVGSVRSEIKKEFASDRTSKKIDPVRAGLLWESTLGLITQVEYLYGYVRFKVQPPKIKDGDDNWIANPLYRQGNAVIAAYDSQRKVLWSWHIWVTDETPKPVTYTVQVADGTSAVFTLLDRNLGATAATLPNDDDITESDILATYGLYYQWGRKDPSMGPFKSDYRPQSTVTQEYYDYFGSKWNYAGVVTIDRPGIKDGVENPMYLILPTDFSMTTYQYDWLYTSIDNLWGDEKTKTIYDPCPYNYMVPQDEISTLFASVDSAPGDYGYMIYASGEGGQIPTFFPFAGYKGADKGVSSLTSSWKYVGEKGDYMSSKIEDTGHRSRTYISKEDTWVEYGADASGDGHGDASRTYESYIHSDDMTNRRTAASVRCVHMDHSLGATLSASLIGDRAYAFVGDGELKLNYTAHTNGNGYIVSAELQLDGTHEPPIEGHIFEAGSQTELLSGTATYNVPAEIGNGLARYRLITKASTGVISRVSHMLRLFDVTDLKIGGSDYKEVECSSTKQYAVSFTLHGVESQFSVRVNGKDAKKTSSNSGEDDNPDSMTYEVGSINIPGHIHIQIIDAFGNLACETSYDVTMSDSVVQYDYSIDLYEYIRNVEQLEGGGLYMLVSYQTYNSANYCLVNRDGKLVCEKYDYDNKVDKDMLFRFHKSGAAGGVSSYTNINAGVWRSEVDGQYLKEDLTFGSESDAVYMTLSNLSSGYYSELYLRNQGIQFGLTRKRGDVVYDDVEPAWCWDPIDKLWQYFCVYRWRIHPVTAEEVQQ